MANFIIFMIFTVTLVMATSIAICVYIATEKGLKISSGIICGLFPIFGQIFLAFKSTNDSKVVEEMYNRNLISLDKYNKTMEVVIKKETQELQLKKKKIH